MPDSQRRWTGCRDARGEKIYEGMILDVRPSELWKARPLDALADENEYEPLLAKIYFDSGEYCIMTWFIANVPLRRYADSSVIYRGAKKWDEKGTKYAEEKAQA